MKPIQQGSYNRTTRPQPGITGNCTLVMDAVAASIAWHVSKQLSVISYQLSAIRYQGTSLFTICISLSFFNIIHIFYFIIIISVLPTHFSMLLPD